MSKTTRRGFLATIAAAIASLPFIGKAAAAPPEFVTSQFEGKTIVASPDTMRAWDYMLARERQKWAYTEDDGWPTAAVVDFSHVQGPLSFPPFDASAPPRERIHAGYTVSCYDREGQHHYYQIDTERAVEIDAADVEVWEIGLRPLTTYDDPLMGLEVYAFGPNPEQSIIYKVDRMTPRPASRIIDEIRWSGLSAGKVIHIGTVTILT